MPNISQAVREFLGAKPPLSVVHLKEIYEATNGLNHAAVRAALYHQAAGSPVARRDPPSNYYAIFLPVQYTNIQTEDIFLSLPGIPRHRILQDVPSTGSIQQIVDRLRTKYGVDTIEYWAYAAQYRTVDQARPSMRRAVARDGTCRLCRIVNDLRETVGLTALAPKPIRASHIVSRKAIFWTILDEVDQQEGNIFTDSSVILIKQKLRDEPLHSDEQFIIALCTEHDKLLLSSLRSGAT